MNQKRSRFSIKDLQDMIDDLYSTIEGIEEELSEIRKETRWGNTSSKSDSQIAHLERKLAKATEERQWLKIQLEELTEK